MLHKSVDVKKEFSMYQFFHWGSTPESQNAGIPEEVIQANNWQRKHLRAKGMKLSMSMMEYYSDARVGVPSLVRFLALLPG